MTKVRLFPTNLQFTDINGNTLSNGYIYVYANQTPTLASLYSNSTGTLLETPYAPIDTNGRSDFYVDANTAFSAMVANRYGTIIATQDDLSSIPDTLYAQIPDGQLNMSQLSTITANRLIGSNASGVVSEITLSGTASLSGGTLSYTGTTEGNSVPLLYCENVTSISSLDLTAYLSTSYDIYYLTIENLVAGSATYLGAQLSTDAGANWLTTASYDNKQYCFFPTTLSSDSTVTTYSGYTSPAASNAAGMWLFTYNNSHAVNGTKVAMASNMAEGIAKLEVELINVGIASSYPIFTCKGSYQESGSNRPTYVNNYGTYGSSISSNGFKIIADGTFSARITFQGLKNS